MKILHLASAKSWRGGEQQIAYLITELAKKKIDQVVFCPTGSPMEKFCRENKIAVVPYKKRFSLNPFVALQVKNYCKKNEVDLIHVHDNHAHTFAWLAALLFGNKPQIVVSRRVDFSINKNRLSLAKYQHSKVARIVCVSEAIRQIVLKDYPHPEKVVVVYSGIDLEKFGAKPDGRLRKKLGLSPNDLLIGNVAAIAPHKDYFTFVDTAKILLAGGQDAHFVAIGGDGGERELIQKYIEEKGITDRVHLPGFREDVPVILPELDLFLFTSKTEGLGTSLLDVLACGIPVIATAAGGIPEIIKHQETGLTAPVADASTLAKHVLSLVNDRSLSNQLVEAGKALVQSFSKEETAIKTLAIYHTISKRE